MMRSRLGCWLRRIADRVDYRGAPCLVGWSFTYELGVGLVWHEDPVSNQPFKGCPVWYFPEQHDLAFVDS
jgi:hypothetical protein